VVGLLLAFFVVSGAVEFGMRQLHLSYLYDTLLGAFAFTVLIAAFTWIAFRFGVLRWIPARGNDEP